MDKGAEGSGRRTQDVLASRIERMSFPEVVAHRGLPAVATENTLASFEAALAGGVRFVECDVLLTKDAVPVLHHDRDLLRFHGLPQAVHELPLRDLRQRLTSLADFVELLRRTPGVCAFVELKRQALEVHGPDLVLERVLAELQPLGTRAVLISFDCEVLRGVRARSALRVGPVLKTWKEHESSQVRALDADYLFVDLQGVPDTGSLHAGAADTVVYEVAEASVARSLAARGVRMVESFDSVRLQHVLRGAAGSPA